MKHLKNFDETVEKIDLDLLLTEIKSMSETEVDEMINENKLSLEKIGIELTYQRIKIEKILLKIEQYDENFKQINENFKHINGILNRNNLK